MLNFVIEYIEGYDPLFSFLDSYLFYFIAIYFLLLYFLLKNILALLVSVETITSTFIEHSLEDETMLLVVTAQFIIYCFMIFLTKRSPLIAVAYILLSAFISIKYLSAIHHANTVTLDSYNVAALIYYSYFLLLIPVLFMIDRGLSNSGGKKDDIRDIDNKYNAIYDNCIVHDSDHSRPVGYYEKRN